MSKASAGKKIYVKTGYDGCGYITAGKVYKAKLDNSGLYYKMVDDEGDLILFSVKECNHLEGHTWQVVDKPAKKKTKSDAVFTLKYGVNKPHYKSWSGGECPVDGKTPVEVVFRRGEAVVESNAGCHSWSHPWMPLEEDPGVPISNYDIIAYRVIN